MPTANISEKLHAQVKDRAEKEGTTMAKVLDAMVGEAQALPEQVHLYFDRAYVCQVCGAGDGIRVTIGTKDDRDQLGDYCYQHIPQEIALP